MPQQAWNAKRERQYKHIKSGLKKRGETESTAEEIAARTVNKERGRAGESTTRSRSSVKDISSGRRGGLRRLPRFRRALAWDRVGVADFVLWEGMFSEQKSVPKKYLERKFSFWSRSSAG